MLAKQAVEGSGRVERNKGWDTRQGEVGHIFARSAHDPPKHSSGMQQMHSIARPLAPSCLLSCAWPPCATVPGTCRAAAVNSCSPPAHSYTLGATLLQSLDHAALQLCISWYLPPPPHTPDT